ncbi:MAG: phosphonate transport system substrate-binding protein [Gammaproteobacteria bacterium]|jgi:phosphonate transport system substrate-binding protein
MQRIRRRPLNHHMSAIIKAALTTVMAIVPLAPSFAAQAAGEIEPLTFTFGIVPQQLPSKLLQSWGPVLRYLQQRTGHRFVFRTAADIPTFEQRVTANEYDFAYMNPYHFTVYNHGDTGYQALAKAKDKRIHGILVVRKDSALRTLAELQGATLAFPAPAAFAASVLPRAHLKAESTEFDVRYVSSHDSVYKAVAKGLFPAGGGVLRTFNATDPAVRQQLRILWTSPGYTPHAIAVHPRVPQEVVESVRRALVVMADDEAGRLVLDRLKVKGFAAAANANWDDVRALRIDTRLGNNK